MKKWTLEEVKFIKKNYNKLSTPQLAKQLGRTIPSVSRMMKRFNIKRSESVIKRLIKQFCSQAGSNHPNWKGGISQDNYHYRKIQVERYPERIRARQKTYKAIRNGKLKKEPCEVCGSLQVYAHHDDYAKPLEVRWLCRKHHREVHGGRY